jgi:LytTr DNA-binding domain
MLFLHLTPLINPLLKLNGILVQFILFTPFFGVVSKFISKLNSYLFLKIQTMLTILFQPYPFNEKTLQRIILQGCYEGAFVALFLIIIQPFGISEMQSNDKNWVLIYYGIVTTAAGYVLRLGIFRLFPSYFSEPKWTILKEITTILGLILLITMGNYALTMSLFNIPTSLYNFVQMLLMVATIGIFPTVFGVMLNYIIQLKKYNRSFSIEKPIPNNSETIILPAAIKLIAENEKDQLELGHDDLFYIESSDNYSTVFYQKGNRLQQSLIRSSLSRFENQIQSPHIVRCHRSFIVNLEKVAKVSGNAQGYRLHLDGFKLQVPVARKYSAVVNLLKI